MFIALEGIDGCGKTTQAARLYSWLVNQQKIKVTWTREPGDWDRGNKVRQLLTQGTLRHPLSELLLFAADRCENVAQKIQPALDRGEWVICDRYNLSTLVYQGGLKDGLPRAMSILRWCEFPTPNLTTIIDCPAEVAMERLKGRTDGNQLDNRPLEELEKLREGFKMLGRARKALVVDGNASSEVVASKIQELIRPYL